MDDPPGRGPRRTAPEIERMGLKVRSDMAGSFRTAPLGGQGHRCGSEKRCAAGGIVVQEIVALAIIAAARISVPPRHGTLTFDAGPVRVDGS
jgi:hypothetical protein